MTAVPKDDSGSEARKRAGDLGTFADVLSDLSRRETQGAGTGGLAEGGVLRDGSMAAARASSDLDSALPNAASDRDSTIAAFVDRVSDTGSRAHQRDATPRGAARDTGLPLAQDDLFGSDSETARSNVAAPGGLETPRRRIGLTTKASSEPGETRSAVPVPDPSGPTSSLGTGLALSAQAGVLSAAANGALQPTEPDGPVEASGVTDRSRKESGVEGSLASPASSDQASPPQRIHRHGRVRSKDAVPDGVASRIPTPFDVARKPGSAEPIFAGRNDRPALRAQPREPVTVLAAETHFPPVVAHSPIDQIMQRISAELGSAIAPADPRRPPGSGGDPGEPREATAACVRSLTVLLEPASLGPVTIKLRLSGATLGLEIEADEVETTRLIGRGRQALTEKLRALGLSVDTFVVSDNVRQARTT